ncbi:MAG: hypothetical protein LBO66_12480 [Deltaproteobacteria bacterium]|jgi:hypothetical protein|nr:hypothetical protein [Deltaproteobacteria bacterium]
MATTEDKLRDLARQILDLPEDELVALLPKFQRSMEKFSSMEEWKEAILLYFLINGRRVMNIQYSERHNQLLSARFAKDSSNLFKDFLPPAGGKNKSGSSSVLSKGPPKGPPRLKPHLSLVK